MKFIQKHRIFFGLFVVTVIVSACAFPEKDDPFSHVNDEPTQIREGEIFPFSVSIATRASHRLEKDGKLVSYLASDIVRLDDFVGRSVEVTGVMKTEKMREIFFVEAIRLLDVENTHSKELEDQLFSTKRFAFIYPSDWEHSISPAGLVHFTKKDDPARRVFLIFSVEELERRDRKIDPNVLISNLAGTKNITTDELDRERQEVVLFSNVYDQKYHFVFTSQFEEFEKKKRFFKLLNTFVEGEESVSLAEESYQRKIAELEAEKIKETSSTAEPSKESQAEVTEKDSFLKKLFGKNEKKSDTATEEPLGEKETEKIELSDAEKTSTDTSLFESVIDTDFTNLIDDKAFSYESSYYKLRMHVPWGYWFRNFGPNEGHIARIGFSDEEFTELTGAKFWLEIVSTQTPPTHRNEKENDTQLIIEFPRNSTSYFRFTGLKQFRNAMRSIEESIQIF